MTTMSIMNLFCLKLVQTIFLIYLVLQADQLVCSKEVVKCIQSERLALLQFKAGLTDPYDMLSSWTTQDCCQWYGIGCSNLTGHVLMLDLRGNYLSNDDNKFYISGNIHKSLMDLQQLKYLKLSQNDFVDISIPGFFGYLRNLRYLDLSHCYFNGQIPVEFKSLSHLNYLNLSWNRLDGLIPHRLGDLSNLQFLDLSNNVLEGSIPSQLGNLSNLQFLDLRSNNYLEGSIPSQLGKLSNLQELYLEGGYSSGSPLTIDNKDHSGGQWLSNLTSLTHLHMLSISNLDKSNSWLQMVGKLPKLRELSLENCGLSDHFIHSPSHSKFNFSTSISILDLSRNNFASSLIFQWVSDISPNIVELDLSRNQIVDPPSNHFSCRLPKLRKLRLSHNQFTSFMIFQWVSNISSNLVILDLSFNVLEGPRSYGYDIVMKSLERLDLSNNRLKGSVFKSFMNLCTLRLLDLNENNFSEDFQSIIHNLSSGCVRNSLQVLDLSSNGITGTIPDLSKFTSLKTLDLNYNQLSGNIHEGSSLPFQLEQLSVASNYLEGVIPKSFWMNACKLKSLEMSDNRFSGELQVTIHHLSRCARYSLKELDLSVNQINGTLSDLSTFSFLEIFDISENRLNGEIFEKIRFPSKLRILWMNSNSLKGVISDFQFSSTSMLKELDLSNTSLVLRFIDLSKNKFSDPRPFLCANGIDEMLSQLDISNNQLSGRIPYCWRNFKSLAYVDLSHNNFSGKIPTSMGSLVKLQALLLTNNSLTGEIPSSLMNCKELVMLDLRDNRLEGLIPYWIGSKLKDLQVLSLQRNHFFGSLPFELCYLQNVQLLDLSLNNLSGHIPKCIQNLTSMTEIPTFQLYANHAYLINDQGFQYKLHALLTWKGAEQVFNNNELVLLKIIDLSSNHFSGEIPPEVADLTQLISLNLSRNKFIGKIPSNIGNLTLLDFLDLSRNKLLGSIPSSITQIYRLSVLDLSHNQLSGEIPKSTQLQSFDPSRYEKNLALCGPPLVKLCVDGKPAHEPKAEVQDDEDLFLNQGFYISLTFGFIIGFWGVFGSILVKRSWRHAYFKFMNNLMDKIYVKCRWGLNG